MTVRWVVVAIVAAAAIVAVGRWERVRAVDRVDRGMAAVVADAGSPGGKRLSAYRLTPTFDCLLYRAGANVVALELCYDGRGRLVEAIDRRKRDPRFWTLRADPGASRIREPVHRLAAIFRRIGAPDATANAMPHGHDDTGPTLIHR